jgi:tRNA modification GTPase
VIERAAYTAFFMMLSQQSDPIVAIATAPGRGAIGVIRVSGQNLGSLTHALCGKSLKSREATYVPFRAQDGTAIDHGLAIYFESPNSFTGEDVLELQAHGGPVVLQMLLKRCLQVAAEREAQSAKPRLPGLRMARPGEFSQRAFLNNKIDLAQAEAIADLIDASTEAAAVSASRSLAGEFSKEIRKLTQGLIQLRTLVEATLDFPEEEVDILQEADALGQLDRLVSGLQEVTQQAKQGKLLREGIKVVIAGQPNAGKSSLLNKLAGSDLAIVTPVEGTTRDKIEQTIQLEGVPVHIIDTAGLRASENEIEKLGIERTWMEIKGADVVLFLHDLTRREQALYAQSDEEIATTLAQSIQKNVPVLDVWNKLDMNRNRLPEKGIALSAKTGEGIEQLQKKLLALAGWHTAPEGVYMARERHLLALAKTGTKLTDAREKMAFSTFKLDLMAEDLRLAQNALNDITGEFTNDDLLGMIFSKFCIGK